MFVKYTLKQHISLIRRGFKAYSAASPLPVILSSSLSAVFEAAVPFVNLWFSARILNELAGARDAGRLTALVLWTVSLNLAALLAQKALTRWAAYCQASNFTDIKKIYSDKMLSMNYRDAEDTAVQRKYNDINGHHTGMGFGFGTMIQALPEIIKGAIQIGISAALAFALFAARVPPGSPYEWLDSPWVKAATLLLLLAMFLLAPYLSILGGKVWRKASQENSWRNRFHGFYFYSMIQGGGTAKDIRMYGQKKIIQRQLEGYDELRVFTPYARYDAKLSTLGTAVSCLCNGMVYLYAALKALSGAFGVGDIVLYAGAITQFGSGLSSALCAAGQLINNNPFLDKVFQFLDIPNAMYQGSLTTEKRTDHKYELEFRNVSFKYPSSGAYALRNVSLKFNVGQRLAIVGQNGSGKTTFIKLLCRLYDPDEGEILLNGIDIKKYNYDEYMAIYSVVFQDFGLLPQPLGQNVASRVDIDGGKVVKTLENAGFGERLSALPNGTDTYVFKNFEGDGVEVSGGEAQKIALARALYKDAPFIILDEPTAALDPIAEFEVYSKMNEIVGDKTAVFISHRLSSCRFCNDIAVFHEGRVIQRGGHDELVADEGGKYYELWNAQAQYYTDAERVELTSSL